MSEKQPRPGQASLAAALIIGGSVFLILLAGGRISWLHSLEGQEGMQRWIDQQNIDGLTVDGISTTLRILTLVGAGAAAAAAILGLQVLQRSSSARIALTLLAPFLLVGGFAIEGFLAPLVFVGIVMLWLQPTRDWYAGRPWVQAHQERRTARLGATQPSGTARPTADPFASPHQQPQQSQHPQRAQQPEDAQPTAGDSPAQLPGAHPSLQPAQSRSTRPDRAARPGGLVVACVLAWTLSGATALYLTLTALASGPSAAELYDEMQRQQPDLMKTSGISEQDLVASFYIVLGGLVLWSIAALVLAGLTFVGHNWARIVLVVSAICAALLALVMSLSAPSLLGVVILLGVNAWLLLRPDVARWFSS